MHRVHTPQPLAPGIEVTLEEAAAHYLGRVLRVVPGQPLVLFNGDGCDYAAEVCSAARHELVVEITSRLPGLPEPALDITVVQAISRGERMDQTLQKCTELGASSFQPITCERVEVRLAGQKLAARVQHWQGVVIAACEQCGRARVPAVRVPLSLQEWASAETGVRRLVLDPGAESPLASVQTVGEWQIAVGPEGGFSEGELALMRRCRIENVSLGPRVLRTETAGPAAVAVLQCLGGDLGPLG